MMTAFLSPFLPAAITPDLTQALLAYRPFIDAIDIDRYWYFTLIPLALGISLTFKAVRVQTFDAFPRQVLTMAALIILGIVGLGLLTLLVVTVGMPMVASK